MRINDYIFTRKCKNKYLGKVKVVREWSECLRNRQKMSKKEGKGLQMQGNDYRCNKMFVNG